MTTPAELIAEIIQLDDWMDAQQKKFSEYLKPQREQIELLKNKLQEQLLKLNTASPTEHPRASFSTDAGTAYLSTIVTPSIEGDKTKFLDWILDNPEWEHMLQIGAPQKAAFEEYREKTGQLPPNVRISSITRVNVRRS